MHCEDISLEIVDCVPLWSSYVMFLNKVIPSTRTTINSPGSSQQQESGKVLLYNPDVWVGFVPVIALYMVYAHYEHVWQ